MDSVDPVQRAHDQIRQTLVDIGGIIDGVASRVKDILASTLQAIFEPLGGALEAATSIMGELASGLLSNLATPAEIVDATIKSWSEYKLGDKSVIESLADWLTHSIPQSFGQYLADHVNLELDPAYSVGDRDGDNPPPLSGYKDRVDKAPGFLKVFHNLAAAILVINAYANAEHSANILALEQATAQAQPVAPLTADQLALAVVQSQVPQDWAAHEVKRVGLTDELFDLMVKIAGLPPGLEQMLSLLNRGVVDEATVRQSIAESHTKTKYTDALLALRYAVPTPAEITHWLTRDAFIDDFVKRYGMDAEYDLSADKADPLFQANAVSKDYIKYIWRAHWTLPSPGAGAEMFQRTSDAGEGDSHDLPGGGSVKSVLGLEDLNRLYRAAGYEPFWRDKLLKIAYNPLTRIDSRRMYLAGLIDDARFYRAQLDIGYDEATAGLLLTWIQAQKAAAQKAQAEKHFAPLVTHMRDLYRRGLMGAPDVQAQAQSLGFDSDEIALWLQTDDLDVTRIRADKIRDGIHRLYVGGFISEDEAAQRASDDGFTTAEWVRLRDEWNVEREFSAFNDDEKRARELTKTQLIAAYKDRLLSGDDLVSHLQAMGYHADEIAIWVSLADYEETKRVADLRREAVHADYVDEITDVVDARSQLAGLQLPAEHVEALLARWTAEQRRREPKLDVAEVRGLFINELIDSDKARELLHGLRYHDREIDYLEQLWSLDMGVTAERLAIQHQRIAIQQAQFAERQATAAQARQQTAQERQQAQQAAAQRRIEAASTAFQRSEQKATEAAARQQQRLEQAAQNAAQRQAAAIAERERLAVAAAQARAAAAAATDERQKRALSATADRQQRAFEHADKAAQTADERRQSAEARRDQFRQQAEARASTRQLAHEQRQQQFKIAGETRAEQRGLRAELRRASVTRAREERATAARIAAEGRVAERQQALASATAAAQQQIATLRGAEGAPVAAQAEADFQGAIDAAKQRLSNIGGST